MGSVGARVAGSADRVAYHFLPTSHTTRAHTRARRAAAFSFFVICLSYGVGWCAGVAGSADRVAYHFLPTSHTTRAHTRARRAAAFSFLLFAWAMGSVGARVAGSADRVAYHFLPTSHTTRAHTRARRAAAFSFFVICLSYGVGWCAGGRQRRSRCLSFFTHISHYARAHAREASGGVFFFCYLLELWGRLVRGWPAAPIALPRVLGSLASRIETAGVGGRAVVHPLGAPAAWVAVGLRRVLVRLRMVVGGRMPSPTFRMVVRRWRAFGTKIAFVAGQPPAGVGECHH